VTNFEGHRADHWRGGLHPRPRCCIVLSLSEYQSYIYCNRSATEGFRITSHFTSCLDPCPSLNSERPHTSLLQQPTQSAALRIAPLSGDSLEAPDRNPHLNPSHLSPAHLSPNSSSPMQQPIVHLLELFQRKARGYEMLRYRRIIDASPLPPLLILSTTPLICPPPSFPSQEPIFHLLELLLRKARGYELFRHWGIPDELGR
jgi:hypothetical protein